MTVSRRYFLSQNALGLGSLALAWLLQEEQVRATSKEPPKSRPLTLDMRPKQPQFVPRAKAMISLFQHGGPSHMDLTDPKPELSKYDGTDFQDSVDYSFSNNASKKLLGTKWKFKPHGQCGTELSELLPHTADIVDDICLIRS